MANSTVDDLSFSISCPNDAVCLIEVTIVIAVTVLTLLSNVGNLKVLLFTPSFRNSHGYLLISLSVADLGVGAVAMLSVYPSATLRGSADSWPYGDTVCLISAYTLQVFLANSGLTLTLMSIERYIAIGHPLKYSQLVTKKSALICIAACWIISMIVFSMIFVGIPRHRYSLELYTCVPMLNNKPVCSSILFFVGVLPSLIIIVISSLSVSKKLKENSRRLASANPYPIPSCAASEDSQPTHGTFPVTLKLFQMVRVMTFAVLVCWLPFMCIVVVVAIFNVTLSQLIYFATFWLLISNSGINSVIYLVMNKQFSDRITEIFEQAVPLYCRKFNELEKDLVCPCCFCNSKLDLTTSADNSVKMSHPSSSQQDIPDNCVELKRFRKNECSEWCLQPIFHNEYSFIRRRQERSGWGWIDLNCVRVSI